MTEMKGILAKDDLNAIIKQENINMTKYFLGNYLPYIHKYSHHKHTLKSVIISYM